MIDRQRETGRHRETKTDWRLSEERERERKIRGQTDRQTKRVR